MPPTDHREVEGCVERTIARVGPRIVLGAPLGLGKPAHLLDAFYRRAKEDSRIELVVLTALTLDKPSWKSELERRLVEPLVERLYGGVPDVAWARDLRDDALPENVEIREFYFPPGAYLGVPAAQASYMSSNYTHVVRDVLDAGVNVVAQLVGRAEVDGRTRYSLSSNPDVGLDLVPKLRAKARDGFPVAVLGEINEELPFMYGPAMVEESFFDDLVAPAGGRVRLFGVPSPAIETVDYAIALHASALVRDGGTIQLGIGSLGDAITRMLEVRHHENAAWNDLLEDAGGLAFGDAIDRIGERGRFDKGLYALSEMFVGGFLDLRDAGILRRRVYPHAGLQRLLDEGRIGESLGPESLGVLRESGVVPSRLDEATVRALREVGLLRRDVDWEDGALRLGDGRRLGVDLEDADGRGEVAAHALGERLVGGVVAHASFFLGSEGFYRRLREMPPEERREISMSAISWVNELYGDEELKRAQRRDARFLNSCLMVTALGAAVSDALEDGRVVSGVGGQYNFVAMAHALDDGRSILLARSTRDGARSNVLWSYGHVTIPRHLRDVIVTEYGIADLRGKSDRACVEAMLAVTDSRYQAEIVEAAKRSKKLPPTYRVPDRFRENRPERLEAAFAPYRHLLPEFPYGTDLTPEEVVLRRVLGRLAKQIEAREPALPPLGRAVGILAPPAEARPYLERMGLAEPETVTEWLLQKTVLYALVCEGVL